MNGPAFNFEGFAAELAKDQHMVEQLLLRHIPDGAGKCCACTTGGTGQRDTAWPCGVHGVAAAARRVQLEQHDGSTS